MAIKKALYKINMVLQEMLESFQSEGKLDDYVNLLKVLHSSKLSLDRIALTLCHKVGCFVNLTATSNMHYLPDSLSFGGFHIGY